MRVSAAGMASARMRMYSHAGCNKCDAQPVPASSRNPLACNAHNNVAACHFADHEACAADLYMMRLNSICPAGLWSMRAKEHGSKAFSLL